ncbi:MAG: DUF1588 domain-containing protein, partial [Lentisphaeraceae bacterium]|nr:DUF1588 domain-containing protein [Lentisphaeraceae bacterium]
DFPVLNDHKAYVRVVLPSGKLTHPHQLDLKKSRGLTLETVLVAGSQIEVITTINHKDKRYHELRRLKSLTIEGPLKQHNIFTELTSCESVKEMTVENGTKLLSNVLPLLYGRPAPKEIEAYKKKAQQGQSPLEASKKSIKQALLSLEFLYGVDIRAAKSAASIAIAKRMSRVLWRSIPDRELLTLAAQKKLSDPKVRRKQVLRMMKDSRFQRFKSYFFSSWLGNGHFYKKENPTKDYFPQFHQQGKLPVLWSLYEQQKLYLNDIIDNDRSIVDLVSSNWTYANKLISKNYGLGIKNLGNNLTKVKLLKNSIRGGILTQGVFARLTSSVNDTSPVKRGVWILENIMATHIPSPPQVEGFEPNTVGATSVKDQFLKHREHKACASCHNKIDPIGFLFESLDPLGGTRAFYAKSVHEAKKKNPTPKQAVDTSSLSFKGNAFNNLNDFKKYIRENSQDTIVKSYMYKLVKYTFGRKKDFTDKYRISKLIKADKTNFKTKTLLVEFICSSLFIK